MEMMHLDIGHLVSKMRRFHQTFSRHCGSLPTSIAINLELLFLLKPLLKWEAPIDDHPPCQEESSKAGVWQIRLRPNACVKTKSIQLSMNFIVVDGDVSSFCLAPALSAPSHQSHATTSCPFPFIDDTSFVCRAKVRTSQ
jgi:hypothetical protein